MPKSFSSTEENAGFESGILQENVTISPSVSFKINANVGTDELFEQARLNRLQFWADQALCLDWFEPWEEILDWNPPFAKWFLGGKLNASYNCLDRHLQTPVCNKIALLWEGERGEERSFTYLELYKEVNRFSNVLKSLGVKKGDKVAIYMPMIPEAVVAMLSCARIGAVHTVVFAGFSAEALKDRILDAEAKVLITADGGYRKGKVVPTKLIADEALKAADCVQKVVVVKRTGEEIPMDALRDHWYGDLMKEAADECLPEVMDSEDELFILYTSGTTGKPKGIVHSTGGYLLGAMMSMRWVFDVKPTDIYWCTADVGWITGHSYVAYGPLCNGLTQVMYEGVPDFPERDRFWKIIEKYRVTILYTAPTAIRTFMKWGDQWPDGCDLSSLRVLGTVGEPINPEAWLWYHRCIGKENCPVVDTWWQTETGSIMVAPLPGITDLKPGSATFALPGIDVNVLDEEGNDQRAGYLAVTSPWPSMLRGIHKDPVRFKETYWRKWEGKFYFTGDSAKKDDEGYIWLTGRVDDVINVSGHRLGVNEIESALIDHSSVAEAAVIAVSHPIKGQAINCFVNLKEGQVFSPDLEVDLKQHVVNKIGAIARPERIIFIGDLPKTRSGKVMRRLLRDIAEGRIAGDMTTLSDPTVIEAIKGKYKED